MIGPVAKWHYAPVARPWWKPWARQRYVKCYCSFQSLIDVFEESRP